MAQDFDPEDILRARRGYFGNVSYVDDQVGILRGLLERLGLADNTIIVVTSDHGESLGERGLWFKRNHYDSSARVPFIFHAPQRFQAAVRGENVSLIDLLPTVLHFAGDQTGDDLVEAIEGRSLAGLIEGDTSAKWDNVMFSEVMSDGLPSPVFMVRRDHYKLICGPAHPAQLYDMQADPHERNDLALNPTPEILSVLRALQSESESIWDGDALQAEIEHSVARRTLIRAAHNQGRSPDWDFYATTGEVGRWCRGGGDYNAWAYSVLSEK